MPTVPVLTMLRPTEATPKNSAHRELRRLESSGQTMQGSQLSLSFTNLSKAHSFITPSFTS